MNTPQNRATVTRVLEEVQILCNQNRALVLTESDLKCLIYSKLLNVPTFGEFLPTYNNGPAGIAIHSETKFFDADGLLRQAPDLVLIRPADLSIVESIDGDPMPRKGYRFIGNPILIELKFLRYPKPPRRNMLATIRDDIEKGQSLARRRVNCHMFVAVFDRFRHGRGRVEELFAQEEETIGYDRTAVTTLYFEGGEDF